MLISHEVVGDAEATLLSDNSTLDQDPSQQKLAYEDCTEGLKKWRIWTTLAYQDIRLRYLRSVLGPFWITLSMGITVYSMGFLYARLFHQDLSKYFPFLVAGMLSWALIGAIVTDVADGLAMNEGLIKQTKLPYTLYMHRIACRNILIFFHNIFVIIPIMFLYPETIRLNLLSFFLIPGLLIIYINTISYGLIISMIGARYRDISQVVKSMLQVIFFITPVMWNPEVLGAKGKLIANLNPIYALLELIRQPILGSIPTLKNVIAALILTFLGLFFSAIFFTRYRARIVYWL